MQYGKFREDLFFRLNVIRVVLLLLRARRENIPAQGKYFLSHFGQKRGHTLHV
jgi:two-component system nitrogen regulation response regulator GlnG